MVNMTVVSNWKLYRIKKVSNQGGMAGESNQRNSPIKERGRIEFNSEKLQRNQTCSVELERNSKILTSSNSSSEKYLSMSLLKNTMPIMMNGKAGAAGLSLHTMSNSRHATCIIVYHNKLRYVTYTRIVKVKDHYFE